MEAGSRHMSMLDKGLDIISLLAKSRQPLKISEMADALQIPRTTVYRLIGSLENGGFVRRVGDGSAYFLSLKFLQIAEIVRESLELRRIAVPLMERLRDDLNLAVHLVVRDGDEAVYVEKVESKRPVRLFTQVGLRVPLHVTACPRILLAYCSDEEINKYVARIKMVKYTPATVADPVALWERIRQIRRTGYSVAWGELEPETAAVAVPVYNHIDEVVASLSLAGPEWYFKHEETEAVASRLKQYGIQMSRELGYMGAGRTA